MSLPNPNNHEDKSRIEELEEKLYSRTAEIKEKERTHLRPKKYALPEDWDAEPEKKKEEPIPHSPYAKLFIASLVFFIVSLSAASVVFLSKRNAPSGENVELSVFGPVSVKGGDTLELQILIENKNNVPLKFANLSAEFPNGTKLVADTSKEFLFHRKPLGVIAPGEIRTETVKAVLFGEENQRKQVAVHLDYGIESSSATFTKEKSYGVVITAPPLGLTIELLREISPGQEFTLIADIKSNSASDIDRPVVRIDYPQGFRFLGATPAPSFGDNVWELGRVAPQDKRRIEIRGVLSGEGGQEKIFWIYSGLGKKDGTAFDTVFSNLSRGILIGKPFLGVNIEINGDGSADYVADPNKELTVGVDWVNTLPDKIIDGEIEVKIAGAIINRNSVDAERGYFRSLDNVLFWDKRTVESLGVIESGKNSQVRFSFGLLPLVGKDGNVAFVNPEIEMDVSVKGKRISEGNVPEEVLSFVKRKIKVATDPKFVSENMYNVGPFKNTGPIPPKAEVESTYTVYWKVSNPTNNMTDTRVTAILPAHVRWTGAVAPNGAPVTYNSTSHQVTWDIGRVPRGVGYSGGQTKEVYFQLGVLPSLSHISDSADMLTNISLSALDEFTTKPLNRTSRNLTTQCTADPQMSTRDGFVVQ